MASRVLHVNVEVRVTDSDDATCGFNGDYTTSKQQLVESVLLRVRRVIEREIANQPQGRYAKRLYAKYGHEWKG